MARWSHARRSPSRGRGPAMRACCPPGARDRASLTRPAGAPTPSPAMRLPVLDRLILGAQKPSRYAGGELNAVRKDLARAGLKWALAFPDTYEVGMSNVGFRLLYHALNERPEVACERVFMPWTDMEAALKAEGEPLFSIESRAPLRAFDIEGPQRRAALDGEERFALRLQGGLHVRPRHEHPLAGDLRPLVERVVEQPEAHVAHAHFVRVGERERPLEARPREVLANCVKLAAGDRTST